MRLCDKDKCDFVIFRKLDEERVGWLVVGLRPIVRKWELGMWGRGVPSVGFFIRDPNPG